MNFLAIYVTVFVPLALLTLALGLLVWTRQSKRVRSAMHQPELPDRTREAVRLYEECEEIVANQLKEIEQDSSPGAEERKADLRSTINEYRGNARMVLELSRGSL